MTGTNQPTDDLCCSACDYSLRGLSKKDRCPECGQTVRRSRAIVRLRAARSKKREGWSASFTGGVLGAVVGLIAAIVPLFLMMEISYRITGYDAGNAGVLFCCTVPTFPIIGAMVGVMIAHWIANRE